MPETLLRPVPIGKTAWRRHSFWPLVGVVAAGVTIGCFLVVTSASFSISSPNVRAFALYLAVSILVTVSAWYLASIVASRRAGLPLAEVKAKVATVGAASLILLFYIPIYLFDSSHPALQPYVRYFLMAVALGCALAMASVLFLGHRLDGLAKFVHRRSGWCFAGVLVLFTAAFTGLALWKWWVFGYVGVDTAVGMQAIVYTLKGRFFYTPFEGQRFAYHVMPIEVILVPIYALFRSPYLVPVLIPITISISAIPLYALARRGLSSGKALLVTAIYLLLPYVASRTVMDFHEMIFAPVLVMAAFHFFEGRRFGFFMLFLVLSMWTQEFVAATTLLFSFLALAQHRSRKWILAPAIVSLGWLFIAFKVIIPRFSGSGMPPLMERHLAEYGSTPLEVLLSKSFYLERIFTVKKIAFIYQLLQPYLFFLPLLSPHSVLALPFLAINLALPRTGIRDQEAIILGPILIWAYLSTLQKLNAYVDRHRGLWLGEVRLTLLIPVLCFFVTLSCLPYWFRVEEYLPKPYHTAQAKAIASIPHSASVSAPEYMWARLFERPYIEGLWGLRADPSYPEYLILDVHFQERMLQEGVFSAEQVQDYRRLLSETQGGVEYKGLRLLWGEEGIYVFERSK